MKIDRLPVLSRLLFEQAPDIQAHQYQYAFFLWLQPPLRAYHTTTQGIAALDLPRENRRMKMYADQSAGRQVRSSPQAEDREEYL